MATLIIPPYRAALLTNGDGSPMSAGSDGSAVTTERQWYMFWQGVADQINAGAQAITALQEMVTFGNHGDRPDPGPWPDGALYVEQDRGSVLYQNQGGIWVYIAGQMFGTLVPDERPTDLGPAADVGFAFRTSTDPARAFAWNGGQWVETTPARYDTHAERLAAPVADMVSGMLWIETDRGNAIYQNQAGTWLLLTGTMWGTLSPDQRPTDLGINDAGFTFLSTTTPPRQFIWSSSAWVEVSNGGFTTQTVQTGSRALGTNYPNSTGKTIFVCVVVSTTAGGGAQGFADAAPTPSTQVAGANSTAGEAFTLSFMVQAGHFYRVAGSLATLSSWVEWT
jgi:hypothetical protein